MKESVYGLSKYFNNDKITDFIDCYNIKDIEEFKKALEMASKEIETDILKIGIIESFIIQPNIKVSNGVQVESISLKILFKPELGEWHKVILEVPKEIKKFMSQFDSTIEIIMNGSQAITELNNKIKDIQLSIGSTILVSYKWSIDSNTCSISDWDYDKITVKLGKTSISELIKLYTIGEINNTITNEDWNTSIPKFIENFNKNKLHTKLGAILAGVKIEDILTENMLNTNDILAIIRHNESNTGTQTFKSVSLIKELGRFIVLCKWEVDYNKKKISINIVEDKVLDLDKGIYIRNDELCSRIEEKLVPVNGVYNIIFKNIN